MNIMLYLAVLDFSFWLQRFIFFETTGTNCLVHPAGSISCEVKYLHWGAELDSYSACTTCTEPGGWSFDWIWRHTSVIPDCKSRSPSAKQGQKHRRPLQKQKQASKYRSEQITHFHWHSAATSQSMYQQTGVYKATDALGNEYLLM